MSRSPYSASVPTSTLDFYGQPAIDSPNSAYRPLLDAGALVWLQKQDVLAVGRYDPLRALLKNDEDFVSSRGVTMNPILNKAAKTADTVLVTDGEKHSRLRRVMMAPMRPRELESIQARIRETADERVDQLVGRGRFEGMSELASHLPVTIVAELVGLPPAARAKMVSWSKATFNTIGPPNRRALPSLPAVASMFRFQRSLKSEHVEPGTWVRRLFDLRDEGELRTSEALGIVIDYVAPSLDTTIFATGHLLNRLARHSNEWEKLKADPSLVSGAVDESLRIDSVVRAFTRVAAREVDFEGVTLPPDQRILVVYGAANRDERHYPSPDEFDITRNARDHMAFGHGPHACAGTRLARMEMEALLKSILERVERIEVGDPVVSNNNTLYGFDALPTTLI
jgi:cytochrome P450